MSSFRSSFRCSLVVLACGALVPLGCYTVDEEDAGSGEVDGGTVVVSRPDAGHELEPDAGPPPPDAGPPPVEILSFTADATTVAFLAGTTLRWNTRDATSCAVDQGVGSVGLPSGSRFVDAGEPGTSLSYTLTCQGPSGPVSASVTVATELVSRPGATVTSSVALAGLANVNVVTGDLVIKDIPDAASLAVLATLIRVDGMLWISNHASLASVSLPNLAEVGGHLFLDENPALSSLELPELLRVGGRFYVSRSFDLPQADIDAVVAGVLGGEGFGGPVQDYYNDPADVLGAVDQTFWCAPVQDPAYELVLSADGTLLLLPAFLTGTYQRVEDDLRLDIDGVGSVTASTTNLEYDLIVDFTASQQTEPNLGFCWAVTKPGAVTQTPPLASSYACPSYQEQGYEERNSVELGANGQALWHNTRVDLSGSTPQVERQLRGAYVVDGDWYYFAFPDVVQEAPLPPVRFPAARMSVGDELHFLDLLEAQSVCARQ